VQREPTLMLPEIRTEVRTRGPLAPRELPVVELPDEVASEAQISEEIEEISEEIRDDIEEDIEAEGAAEGRERMEPVVDRTGVPESPGVAAQTHETAARETLARDTLARETAPHETPARDTVARETPTPSELPRQVSAATRPSVEWPPEEQRKV